NDILIGPPQRFHGSHREITQRLETVSSDLAKSWSAASIHHAGTKKEPAPCTVFLGIDGAGKSTLAELVALRLSHGRQVAMIGDELKMFENGSARQLQPLMTETIRRKVGNYAKHAGSLKHYKIPKLAELLLRDRLLAEVRRWYSPDLIFMDGSPLLNLVAWARLYSPDELDQSTMNKAIALLTHHGEQFDHSDPIFKQFPELTTIQRLHFDRFSMPEVAVLIDIDPKIACHRISSRGEERQIHETEEKLSRLRQAYLKVCEVVSGNWPTPVTIVDGDLSREAAASVVLDFLRDKVGIGEKPDD
ncbi:MAG: hypothetical protein V3T31_08480, partial [candidate division Zixibacteria bacterium]